MNPGDKEAEAKFKEATEAYTVLSDPEKRRTYDQYGHAAFENGGAGQGGGFGGFDFNGADMGDIFGDIFGDLFGGGRSRRANNGPMRGANLRAVVHITFQEAVFGCEKELELTLKIPAPSVTERCKTGHFSGDLQQMSWNRSGNIYPAVHVWYGAKRTDLSGLWWNR